MYFSRDIENHIVFFWWTGPMVYAIAFCPKYVEKELKQQGCTGILYILVCSTQLCRLVIAYARLFCCVTSKL